MPEGKKPVVPSPAAPAAAKEDSYSAKTHLHQPRAGDGDGYRGRNGPAGQRP